MSDIKELAPCAAPSSEEVKEMVEKLRVIQTVGYRRRAYLAAADLIERLAAVNTNLNSENALLLKWKLEGVPDGCVVVPREPTPKMDFAGAKAAEDMMSATVSKSMGTLGWHVVRDDYDDITLAYVNDEISSVMGIYKAMLAAWEAK